MEYEEIKKDLKEKEKKSRFQHTMGVVETAGYLAKIYGYEEERARLAGLLHDCAKHYSDEEKIAMCHANHVEISDAEFANPSLLHAKCGALVARQKYGIEDEEILHAITVHTTGATHMNLLDEIIFVADYIEPNRDKAPHLKELRKLADQDLELCMFHIMEDTVTYLQGSSPKTMDPTTYQAYIFYRNKLKGNVS